MNDKAFLSASFMLLGISFPLVLMLYQTGFSMFSYGFLSVFIVLLVAILMSGHIVRSPAIRGLGNARLEQLYFQKSVDERKPQSQVIGELEGEGFKRSEIYKLLHDIDPDNRNPELVH